MEVRGPRFRYPSKEEKVEKLSIEDPSFVCKARSANTPDPQDCGWPGCGCDPKANEVLAALDEEGVFHAVEAAATERERERLAARLKIEAETVKHTSHADGLGMGWQALEQRLLEIAAAIREKPSEKVFNTASQFMEHYGAGEKEGS